MNDINPLTNDKTPVCFAPHQHVVSRKTLLRWTLQFVIEKFIWLLDIDEWTSDYIDIATKSTSFQKVKNNSSDSNGKALI